MYTSVIDLSLLTVWQRLVGKSILVQNTDYYEISRTQFELGFYLQKCGCLILSLGIMLSKMESKG